MVLILTTAFLILILAFDEPLGILRQNWIITPIAYVAAAFANATAIGGGFLFVPLFIFVYGLTPLVALKLSLATQAFGMSAGTLGWGRSFIDPLALVAGGLASLAGMALGTLVLKVPGELVKPAFGWISFFIFVAVLLEFRFGGGAQNQGISRWDWRLPGYVIVMVVGGMVTGWTAIAVGEFAAVYLLFVYGIRIEVANIDDHLHAGQFVEAEIVSGTTQPALAVPREAVTLIEGESTVFKLEEGHEFHAETIEVGPTIGDWIVVRGGLAAGDEIAVTGVFHLKSLLLKSSLGEGHAH